MTTARRSLGDVLLLSSGFAGVLFVLTFVILGEFVPGYDLLRDPISALLFTRSGLAQRVNFVVFGVLLCLFAVGLRRELMPSKTGAIVIPSFQFLCGMGVIGAGVFIYGVPHLISDLIAFNSSLVVLFAFAWWFRRVVRWSGWSIYSVCTAALMMALLAAFGFFPRAGGPAGAMEKLATATRTVWTALLTAKLLRGARLLTRKA